MKITIESTTRVVYVTVDGVKAPARIWEGKTDTGIPVICAITRVAAPAGENLEQFDRELQACKPPSPMAVDAIPMRLIL